MLWAISFSELTADDITSRNQFTDADREKLNTYQNVIEIDF